MAARKRRGLGRGLDALLAPLTPGDDTAGVGTPVMVPVTELVPSPFQPRIRMDEGALFELAESIRAQGIIQPILARRVEDAVDGPPRHEIIAGERRLRAAQLAGLERVPVLVREVSDQAAAAMALIENIQREDLNPLEEARGLQRLTDEFGLTHAEAAQAVGRSRSSASNLLRLLQLTEPVQDMLMAGQLDMGHARALLALPRGAQPGAARQVAGRRLSVRQTEALVRRLTHQGDRASRDGAKQRKPGDVRRVEEELSDRLAARVEIRVRKQRGGRIEAGELAIHFASLDELNALVERLRD